MKVIFAIAAFLVAAAYAEETTTQLPPNPCASKFKEDQKRVNVSEACVEKTGLKPEDMPASEEEFAKTFNDKCYGKCLLTELGLLKGLAFDRDAIKNDINDHVLDDNFKTQITEYTMKCLDDAEKATGGSITEENVCKVSAQALYCCKTEELKLKC